MFMGFLASTQVQIDAAKLFLGGSYTAPFWVLVVGLGLVGQFAAQAAKALGACCHAVDLLPGRLETRPDLKSQCLA